jgi:ABC-type antimicrobial peptide transport system permease subunit
MKILRTLKTALRALRRNPMRTGLTALGIIIGVAAVIAVMEIGLGASALIEKTISDMGANSIMVMPGAGASGGISFGGGSVMTLTPEDCEALQRECPAVRLAAPVVMARCQVVYGNHNWVPRQITGTTPELLDVRKWSDLAEGEPFTERDVRNANKVCLLGATLVQKLFEGESPLGKEVRIQNVSFRVIGVLATKGANMVGMDQDDDLIAPWTTIKYRVVGSSVGKVNQSAAGSGAAGVNTLSQLYPSAPASLYPVPSAVQQADTPLPVRFTNVDMIMVAAQDVASVPQAIQQMTAVLHERHHIPPGELDDFNIRDMTEMVKVFATLAKSMTYLLLAVALISLLVGGVGIMNMMLISVTERTREIGLRMAVGAQSSDILRQFLTEAVILTLTGGALGILIGRSCSYIVTTMLNWPASLSVTAVAASVVVSVSIGILFGFYPAWKASRLDPIEALRYE